MIHLFIFLYNLNCFINGYGWVPLLDIKTYNTKKPSEIVVFDKTLVIWEKNNNIIVQDNACLHRKGPLSEGYIDNDSNNLRCSYHGWEFNENGNILSIPQKECGKHCKYNQHTYATELCSDILWINLNDSYCEFPYHVPNITTDTTVVELPYSMNILLENFFDPAHIPFAHHKLQSTRELASSVNSSINIMNSTTLQLYFEDKTLENNEYRNGSMTFYDPCHYELKNIYPDIFVKGLHIYCVPILPHKTRIFIQQEHNDGISKIIYSKIPHWIKHVVTQTFLDSDTMLLYKQEQHLLKMNSLHNCTKLYTTPTTSDYSVHMFNKWLKKYPKSWSDKIIQTNYPITRTREDVFDRYNGHTKNCIYCTNTLNIVENIKRLLLIVLIYNATHNTSFIDIYSIMILYLSMNYFENFFLFKNYVHNEL